MGSIESIWSPSPLSIRMCFIFSRQRMPRTTVRCLHLEILRLTRSWLEYLHSNEEYWTSSGGKEEIPGSTRTQYFYLPLWLSKQWEVVSCRPKRQIGSIVLDSNITKNIWLVMSNNSWRVRVGIQHVESPFVVNISLCVPCHMYSQMCSFKTTAWPTWNLENIYRPRPRR